MNSQIATIAKDNRIRILALAIVADCALGVFDRHVRGGLRYPLGLWCQLIQLCLDARSVDPDDAPHMAERDERRVA